MKSKVVLGIDPGYDRLGWAVGIVTNTNISLKDFGCITTTKKAPLFERYKQLAQKLTTVITTHSPEHLAIETLFFSKNQKTALTVSEARGVILATCSLHELSISEYNPGQIKLAVTGYGRADKAAVEKMVRLQLQLQNEKVLDDTIDALGLLITEKVLGQTKVNYQS